MARLCFYSWTEATDMVFLLSTAFSRHSRSGPYLNSNILYVQEVVTLQKKIFNLFASENEVYTIF